MAFGMCFDNALVWALHPFYVEDGSMDERLRMHVHDLHATILHLMGFDHEKLTFRHAGRDFRLTDVYGHVVHDIIS